MGWAVHLIDVTVREKDGECVCVHVSELEKERGREREIRETLEILGLT